LIASSFVAEVDEGSRSFIARRPGTGSTTPRSRVHSDEVRSPIISTRIAVGLLRRRRRR
jgi:hypothetical protein